MNLEIWRKKERITLAAIAAAVGTSRSHIWNIEAGKKQPSPELAVRIEAFTRGRVTVASLLGIPEKSQRKRSLKEDGESFDAGEHMTISIAVPVEVVEGLRRAGIDIEEIGRAGAQQAIMEANTRVWREANAEAIEASNRWIENHGTLAEQLGLI